MTTIAQSYVCYICKEWAEDIPTHLKRVHGMTVKEYLEKYPQAEKSGRNNFLFGRKKKRYSLEEKEYYLYIQENGLKTWHMPQVDINLNRSTAFI